MNLFSDGDGTLKALIDFHLVTKWKTAGDSLHAARKLARPDSRKILLVGAGNVTRSLRDAYAAAFPEATFTIWNRTLASVAPIRADHPDISIALDLREAVAEADIIGTGTMATEPVIAGKWLQPGQHLDLIGAYRPDMREVDDDALRRARVFVDSRATTVPHIGELMIPLASGAISEETIQGDLHDLVDAFGGSVSAEHGIGRLKVSDLERYGDPAKLAMMRAIKSALDPVGIMNPGAVIRT